MDEKSLIFGVSYSVDSLVMSLLNQKIELDLDNDYYVNISPPPIPDSMDFEGSVISGLFVDLNEDLVKAILVWLRDREKEHMENPKLKFCIDGNLVNIDVQDLEILLNILQQCDERKKPIPKK